MFKKPSPPGRVSATKNQEQIQKNVLNAQKLLKEESLKGQRYDVIDLRDDSIFTCSELEVEQFKKETMCIVTKIESL